MTVYRKNNVVAYTNWKYQSIIGKSKTTDLEQYLNSAVAGCVGF